MSYYGYPSYGHSSGSHSTPDYFDPDFLISATQSHTVQNAWGSTQDSSSALRNARRHINRHGDNASRDAVRLVREHEERRREERAERDDRRREISNARRLVARHGSLASERRPDAVRAVREYEERRRDERLARSLRYQQEQGDRDRREHERSLRIERSGHRRREERDQVGLMYGIPGNYARRESRAGVNTDGSSYYVNRFGVRQDY